VQVGEEFDASFTDFCSVISKGIEDLSTALVLELLYCGGYGELLSVFNTYILDLSLVWEFQGLNHVDFEVLQGGSTKKK